MTEIESLSFTSGLSPQVANAMTAAPLQMPFSSMGITCMGILEFHSKTPINYFVSDNKQNQILSHYFSEICLKIY